MKIKYILLLLTAGTALLLLTAAASGQNLELGAGAWFRIESPHNLRGTVDNKWHIHVGYKDGKNHEESSVSIDGSKSHKKQFENVPTWVQKAICKHQAFKNAFKNAMKEMGGIIPQGPDNFFRRWIEKLTAPFRSSNNNQSDNNNETNKSGSVSITDSNISNSLDIQIAGSGGTDSIKMTITNKTDQDMLLSVPSGAVFSPSGDGGTQKMMVR